MHETMGQKFWRTAYWLFLVVSFCIIGFLLVTMATGYRYNPHTRTYQKTGMVIITDPPRDSVFIMDGKRTGLRNTTRIPNVLPGIYRVQITKPGYISWEETIDVKPSFVVNLSNISLFRKEPHVIRDNQRYLDLLPYYNVPDNRVRIVEDELWVGTRFVSRFSEPPTNALLLPDGQHILYLRGHEMRVIETDGERDELLLTRTSADLEPFALVEDAVVVQDGAETKVLRIQ